MSKSNSWARRKSAASEQGRRRALARWAADRAQEREVDADTARWRALQDAKGRVLREGVTYRGDGTATVWAVRRSVRGRTDQVEIVADGAVVRTLGRTRLRRVLPGALEEKGVRG